MTNERLLTYTSVGLYKAVQVDMPGFVPSANTLKVLVHWLLNGRPELNVLHAEYTLAGPLNPNIANTIFDHVLNSAQWTTFRAFLTPNITLAGVEVIDIRSPDNPGVPSTSGGQAGTAVSLELPPQVSLVITLRTAKTGRSHRGRVYTFGYTASALADTGLAAAPVLPAAAGFVTAFQEGIAVAGGTLAIRSAALPERPAKPGGMLPAKPYEITPVTVIQARDAIWDTNRRRVDLLRR
jgi:hypothetical protein